MLIVTPMLQSKPVRNRIRINQMHWSGWSADLYWQRIPNSDSCGLTSKTIGSLICCFQLPFEKISKVGSLDSLDLSTKIPSPQLGRTLLRLAVKAATELNSLVSDLLRLQRDVTSVLMRAFIKIWENDLVTYLPTSHRAQAGYKSTFQKNDKRTPCFSHLRPKASCPICAQNGLWLRFRQTRWKASHRHLASPLRYLEAALVEETLFDMVPCHPMDMRRCHKVDL